MNTKSIIKKLEQKVSKNKLNISINILKQIDKTYASKKTELEHSLSIAEILLNLNADEPTIIAGLLHDTNNKELIIKEFNEEIYNLIKGVNDIEVLRSKSKEERESEMIKRMLLSSTKDIRTLFIKLAHKLESLRTLKYLSKEQQTEIAKGARDIYAPLAYRLGLYNLKSELEDLSFKILQPNEFKKIKEYIEKTRKNREKEIETIKNKISEELKKQNVKFDISGRPKHFYSIYQKTIKKDLSLDQIFDSIALRIIVQTKRQCYEVLGLIHKLWIPIPENIKDYIANPKPNLYQSLHTIVIGDNQKPVEFQVRTEEMHQIAEAGIAAHWQYKGFTASRKFDQKLNWFKEILEWQKESTSTKEFIDKIKLDVFENDIFCFTPKGKVIQLKKGATPIDFAYAVHTSVGDKCSGAKVNGKIANLKTILNNGDVIEILTSKQHQPSRDWLKFVVSSKAKTKIKQFILKHQNIPVKVPQKKEVKKEQELEESIIVITGYPRAKVKMAQCCQPAPDDKIMGYQIKKDFFTIHNKDCKNVTSKNRKKQAKVYWKEEINTDVDLHIIALDRAGIFIDIFNTIKATGTDITSAKAIAVSKEIAKCSFTIKVYNLKYLKDLVKRMKKIRNVSKVYISV